MSENKQVGDWMSEFAAVRRFIAWKPASQHIVTGDPDESQCSSVLVTLGQLEHFKLNILFVFYQATQHVTSQHNITGNVLTLHDKDLHEFVYLELFITPWHYFENQIFFSRDCAIV